MRLKFKKGRGWILWLIWGDAITPEKLLLDLPSSSTSQGSTDKDICHVMLSVITLCLCSKGVSYELLGRSAPFYLTQDLLGYLGFCHILEGSLGCMASCLHEYTCIWIPRSSTLSIHGLRAWGYEILCCHGIRVPRSNLICYLFIMFNSTPILVHRKCFEPHKWYRSPCSRKKRGFLLLVQIF